MKKIIATMMALIMLLSGVFTMSSCKKKETPTEQPVSENTETETESEETEEKEPEKETVVEFDENQEILTTIRPDSADVIGKSKPVEIDSVILYKDGSIRIIPTGDLKKNELGGSKADSIMPFAESDSVATDIYLMKIGDEGYRTIVALMEDGTISCLNVLSLMMDHIAVVIDNVSGRDNFKEVIQEKGDEGYEIVGVTSDGERVILNPVLLSDQARRTSDQID